MGMSAKERQRAFRQRLAEQYQGQVMCVVHHHQMPGLLELAAFLRQHPELACDGALLREMRTGKYRKIK